VDSGVIRLGSPGTTTETAEEVDIQEPRRGFDHTSFESRLESLRFQRKALLADGRADDANAQLERIRAFAFEEGVTRLEYVAGALIAESHRFLGEGNQEQVYTALEYAESFDSGRPQIHLTRAAAHWEFGAGVLPTARELLRALQASWSRGVRELTLAHQVAFVTGLAVAGALVVFSLLMLLRYQVPFRHEVQEWVCGFASPEWGVTAGWLLLGLPLLAWFGAGWAFVYWIVITFRFMRRSERVTATALLLIGTLALPTYNVTIALFGTSADPAVRNTVSAVVGEYDPDRIVKLRQLVEEHPDDPVYHFLLAQLYTNGRYLEEAFEEYRVAIELRPDLVPAFINIGNVFYTTGQYREAVVNYTRALEREPDSFLAHFNMHLAQSEDFRFKDAEESLQRAREIDASRVAALLSASGAVGDRSRVQDATLQMASIWESAVGGTRSVRFSSERTASAGAVGVPKLVNSISVVSLLGILACYTMLIVSRGKESARRCIRCGRPFCHHCKSARDAKEYCSQCLHLFVLGDGLEPGTKQRKLFEVERYEKRWKRLRKLSSIVLPGAGQLLRGKTALGLLLIVCWIGAVIAAQPIVLYPVEKLIGVDLQAPVFLSAGSVPAAFGGNPLAFVAFVVLLPIWLVGNLWRRKRWVA
jgi:tetratricopeptide (TPR) repeat protein